MNAALYRNSERVHMKSEKVVEKVDDFFLLRQSRWRQRRVFLHILQNSLVVFTLALTKCPVRFPVLYLVFTVLINSRSRLSSVDR